MGGFKVYYLAGIMQHQHMEDTISALKDPAAAPALFEKVLDEGYTATIDTPMNMLWEELMVHFPESKVLLTVRDDTEAWWKSFHWAGNAFAPWSESRPLKWVVDT